MTAGVLSLSRASGGRFLSRLALAIAAAAIVAGVLLLAFGLLAPEPPPPAPVRAPFGLGVREAAPVPSGIGAWLLAMQGSFYRSFQGVVLALKSDGAALWTLLGLGFAYGVFHAAGPGHGKAVIAGYVVASERALLRGVLLSLAAALLQALAAIALVGTATILLGIRADGMSRLTANIELLSFAAVAALGAAVTWRKAGALMGTAALARDPTATVAGSCDHVHIPPPEALDRLTRWRELAGVVVAAGVRPCAGALVILVFTLANGLFLAGVAATFAMALGTALTTGAIAALAVFAKSLALRLAGGRGAAGALLTAGLELLAGAFVLVVGVALLMGLWTGAGAS